MDDQEYLYFLSALGDEFCDALRSVAGPHPLVPQDGYEVFLRAFDRDPTPEVLASLTAAEVEQLRAECEDYLECPGITTDHIRAFVAGVLVRWPVGEQ